MQPLDPATTPSVSRTPWSAASEPAPIVLAFYRRLRNLPLGQWADAARPAPSASSDSALPDMSLARAELRAVMDARPCVVARHRRSVQHAVSVTEGFVHRSVAGRMKKITLTAALALAARPSLPEEIFARLYAPFAELIPLHDLLAPRRAAAHGPGELAVEGRAGAMC